MFPKVIQDLLKRYLTASSGVLVAVVISTSMGAFAQQANDAVVVGSVFDASRAGVAGATVKLTHLATNGVTEVHTDDHGQYRTPPLKIGEYSISVEAEGFKRFSQHGLALSIGDVRQVDAVLEIGQVSETVSV